MNEFLNTLTDFGFKHIFKTEYFLIDFLNELRKERLSQTDTIVSLQYLDSELDGDIPTQRRMVFDILCRTDCGDYIQIEMQKARQEFFIERSIAYLSRLISALPNRGGSWQDMSTVFSVNILDYSEPRFSSESDYINTFQMRNEKNTLKLENPLMVYVEMPKFAVTFDQCDTRLKKWIYFLKNMHNLPRMPNVDNDPVFQRLFEQCRIEKLTTMEREQYNQSILEYEDVRAACDFHKREGHKEGWMEGIIELCINMILLGYTNDAIAAVSKLPLERIEQLRHRDE